MIGNGASSVQILPHLLDEAEVGFIDTISSLEGWTSKNKIPHSLSRQHFFTLNYKLFLGSRHVSTNCSLCLSTFSRKGSPDGSVRIPWVVQTHSCPGNPEWGVYSETFKTILRIWPFGLLWRWFSYLNREWRFFIMFGQMKRVENYLLMMFGKFLTKKIKDPVMREKLRPTFKLGNVSNRFESNFWSALVFTPNHWPTIYAKF